MNIGVLHEWNPFSEYVTPCYVLFQGDLALYCPSIKPIPIKLSEDEYERIN